MLIFGIVEIILENPAYVVLVSVVRYPCFFSKQVKKYHTVERAQLRLFGLGFFIYLLDFATVA